MSTSGKILLFFVLLIFKSPSASAQSLAGEYTLFSGSEQCLQFAAVELQCEGIILTTHSAVFDDLLHEDRFCKINGGRQNKQFNSIPSLQTHVTQVTSRDPSEILKKEIWHLLNKLDGSVLYTQVEHSLILNAKQETITSSKIITRGQTNGKISESAPEDPATESQICVYKKFFKH